MKIWLPCEFGREIEVEQLYKMNKGWFVGITSMPTTESGYAWTIQTDFKEMRRKFSWDERDVSRSKKVDTKGGCGSWFDIPFEVSCLSKVTSFGIKGRMLRLIGIRYDLQSNKYHYAFMNGSGATEIHISNVFIVDDGTTKDINADKSGQLKLF